MESAQGKNQALREAGAVVPTSYESFETSIKETFDKLVSLRVYLNFPYLNSPLKEVSFQFIP